MSAPAAPTAPSSVPSTPAVTLSSLYDVQDVEPTYFLPDPVATVAQPASPAAAAPAAPAPVAAPVATPAPAAAATPAAPAPAPVPAPAPRHPAYLQRQAESLGIHPLVVERLDSDALSQVVMENFQARTAEASARGLQSAVSPPAVPGQVVPQVPQPPVPQTPAFDWGEHEELDAQGRVIGKRKYARGDIDPAVAFHIERQSSEIAELKSFIAKMGQAAQSQQDNAVAGQFDKAFDQMPDVFGTGTAQSLKGKPEFQKRVTVYHAVKGMFGAMPPEVRSTMSIEQAVHAMAASLFNARPAAPAAAATPAAPSRNGSAPTPQQFAGGHVAVPTQRRMSDKPLGPDRAREELEAWLREQQETSGLPAGGDTSIEEFLR